MNETCGCCEGVEAVTPVSNANRPGLSALVYRAGTHATFLETMLARLSSHSLPAPDGGTASRPLLALRTREQSDATIAFLDAWAMVADVLTFYQERIANEGYLRTATERLSVIELARLVGYRPRPGVAASAHLAYTLDNKAAVTILAGSAAKSTPGSGEQAQTFETAEDLYARSEWNMLQVRLTRPQSHLARPSAQPVSLNGGGKPLYLKGTATNLKPNDPLLVAYDGRAGGQRLFRVTKVEPDQAADRTKVSLQPWLAASAPPITSPHITSPHISSPPTQTPAQALGEIIAYYSQTEFFGVNANTATARRVLGHLEELSRHLSDKAGQVLTLLDGNVLPALREEHRLAREANFTKLEPWIGDIVYDLTQFSQALADLIAARGAGTILTSENVTLPALPTVAPPPLLGIFPLLKSLATQPSAQPRSRQQLAQDVAGAFAPTSDNLTRLLGTLLPDASAGLYHALKGVPVTPPIKTVVYALRTRASVFGHNALPEQVLDSRGVPTGEKREWTLFKSSGSEPTVYAFAVNIICDASMQKFSATVILQEGQDPRNKWERDLNDQPISSTTTHTFDLPGNPVNLTLEVPSPHDMDVQFTFNFQTLNAEVVIEYRHRDKTLNVVSTGSNPVNVEYGPVQELSNPYGTPSTFGVGGNISVSVSTRPTETENVVSLDASYKKILPGGWAVIERPVWPGSAETELLIRRILSVSEGTRVDYSMTATGTQLQLDGEWINPGTSPTDRNVDDFDVIRHASVFAESEPLELAEEPLDPVVEDVCGDQIELAGVVAGLEAGRWLIVTGERTDVLPAMTAADSNGSNPAPPSRVAEAGEKFAATAAASPPVTSPPDGPNNNGGQKSDGGQNGAGEKKEAVAGVTAAELVMLSGVEQSYDPTQSGETTHTVLHLAKPLAYCYRRDTVRVYGNVVRATQGETRTEVLGSGDASKAMQSFTLRQSPLTYVSAPTPSGVESTLRVRVNDVLWHETDTLAGLTPLDREYVTKTDEGGATTIVFGNGRAGARLPTGSENVRAVYRSGIGKGGNLKAGQINQPVTKPLGARAVTNPLASTGGADGEGRDEARRNAPLAVTALDRLVSTRDYEDFARTFAGVAKASAVRLSDGRRQLVHLTIAGADDIPISRTSDLYQNLREALHKFGDPFQPIQVDTRYLKTLFVSAGVRVHPDYIWEAVEPKVRAALLERFSFNRRDLGQDALLSEAVAAAQSVEGVLYVDFDTFDDIGDLGNVNEGFKPEDLLSLGETLGLRTRVRASLARIDATALDPAARIRPAQLALLTPLVSATLLLREIKG